MNGSMTDDEELDDIVHETAQAAQESEATHEDNAAETERHGVTVAQVLGGVTVAKFVQRQIGVVVLAVILIIVYITNRYLCQQTMMEIDRAERQLTEMRFKATVCASELTEKSRESHIIRLLKANGDTTLTRSQEPPFVINVPEEDWQNDDK